MSAGIERKGKRRSTLGSLDMRAYAHVQDGLLYCGSSFQVENLDKCRVTAGRIPSPGLEPGNEDGFGGL